MRSILCLTIISILFFSCDKNGEPLKNGNKLEIQKDGIRYVDEQSLILPPGAYDGPQLVYTPPTTGLFGDHKENVTLSSSLKLEGQKNSKSFTIIVYLPVTGGVLLNKKYEIAPENGKEIFQKGIDGDQSKIWDSSFIQYTENHNTYYFGTGHIVFTYFDNSGGLSNTKGEGTIVFSIPNESGGRSTFNGSFRIR
ncbi:hypothetical protein [Sphingobacterium suaedae]|uniref:Uncharacterized protein n=1 Tax=Sphingobacterium suaedae TaxID=1686402 RepID=A0ABW5KKR2_9SPHI